MSNKNSKPIKVGITGNSGFLGWHLCCFFLSHPDMEVVPFERSFFQDQTKLADFVKNSDVIVHLAGLNRGGDSEIYETNTGLTKNLINACEKAGASPFIIYSSSTHVHRDTTYGRSKRDSGELLRDWAQRNSAKTANLIFPNIFGEFANPLYNSAVATFCYQLAHREKSEVNKEAVLPLIYAQDAARIIYNLICNPQCGDIAVESQEVKVGELYDTLTSFRDDYFRNVFPRFKSDLEYNLFATLLSYLWIENFPVKLGERKDERGSLFEIAGSHQGGHVFFSFTEPGMTRGNHYHTRKIERFCVIKGEAEIRIRRLFTKEVSVYKVSGDNPVFIDMPRFCAHNITNIGKEPLVTLFWINEIFNADDPDTYREVV
ncbi:MAG: SDR family oxidoreductase [Candidatus Sungbacteria bacterium]|nr:SDR family oxidoreductase [Candidatus Sungbacteria bacterium]